MVQVGLSFAVSKQKVRSRIINLIIGSSYYYTLIAFSPTERLSVNGQLFIILRPSFDYRQTRVKLPSWLGNPSFEKFGALLRVKNSEKK